MYKGAILNSNVNRIAGNLEHTDMLCIADCGLPVPPGVEKVDLAVKQGLPGFWDVFAEVTDHLVVERVMLAEEIKTHNTPLYRMLCERFRGVPIEFVSHEEFKRQTSKCVAVIRTGETHPYANIILQSGCIF